MYFIILTKTTASKYSKLTESDVTKHCNILLKIKIISDFDSTILIKYLQKKIKTLRYTIILG